MTLSLKSALAAYADKKGIEESGGETDKAHAVIPNLKLGGGALTWSKDYLLFNEKTGSWKIVNLNIFERFFRWVFCCLWNSTKLENVIAPLYNETSLDVKDRAQLCDRIDGLFIKTYPHRDKEEWKPKIPYPWSPALEIKDDEMKGDFDSDFDSTPKINITVIVYKKKAVGHDKESYTLSVGQTVTLDSLIDIVSQAAIKKNQELNKAKSKEARRHSVNKGHTITFSTHNEKKGVIDAQSYQTQQISSLALTNNTLHMFVKGK